MISLQIPEEPYFISFNGLFIEGLVSKNTTLIVSNTLKHEVSDTKPI